MKEINITISPEGEIVFETTGYNGKGCIDVFEQYKKFMRSRGIDLDTKDQKKKPEFYKTGIDNQIQIGSK